MQKQLLLFSLLCFIVTTSAGCLPLLIGAAAGAGGVAYVQGKLEENLDNSVEEVHKASLAALNNMNLIITDDDVSRHDALIDSNYDDGEDGKVQLNALTEKSSKISIRVGVFGDEVKSRELLNAIKKRL